MNLCTLVVPGPEPDATGHAKVIAQDPSVVLSALNVPAIYFDNYNCYRGYCCYYW